MKNNFIKSYYDIMLGISNLSKITNDKRLKESSNKALISFINKLYSIDKKDREMYENLLEEFNLNKSNLINVDDLKLVDNKDLNDSKLFEYGKELENIFTNPNEGSIKVWLNNIISYADNNGISEEQIKEYITSEFKKYDLKEEYIIKLDEYLLEIRSGNSLTNGENANKEEIKIDSKEEDLETYIFNNLYANNYDELGNDFKNIMYSMDKAFTKKDEIELKILIDRYVDFVNKNDMKLDRNKMLDYLKKTFEEFNYSELLNNFLNEKKEQKDNSTDNLILERKTLNENSGAKEENSEIQKEQENNVLSIRKIKKSFNTKSTIKKLGLLALVGVGVKLVNPLALIGLGIGAGVLYGKESKEAKRIIAHCGLKLDSNGNIIDSEGKIITKEDLNFIRYRMIKSELSKLNNDKGEIDNNYKKNKFTSMLLNNNVVKKIFKSKPEDTYDTKIGTAEMKLGMRNV